MGKSNGNVPCDAWLGQGECVDETASQVRPGAREEPPRAMARRARGRLRGHLRHWWSRFSIEGFPIEAEVARAGTGRYGRERLGRRLQRCGRTRAVPRARQRSSPSPRRRRR